MLPACPPRAPPASRRRPRAANLAPPGSRRAGFVPILHSGLAPDSRPDAPLERSADRASERDSDPPSDPPSTATRPWRPVASERRGIVVASARVDLRCGAADVAGDVCLEVPGIWLRLVLHGRRLRWCRSSSEASDSSTLVWRPCVSGLTSWVATMVSSCWATSPAAVVTHNSGPLPDPSSSNNDARSD